MLINIVSAYAPQVGCDEEEKAAFWADLEEVVERIPGDERLVIGADLNAHVGKETPTMRRQLENMALEGETKRGKQLWTLPEDGN